MIKDIFDTYRDAFRQWVRNKTKPRSILEAEEKRLFWSKCYLFSVLCVMGFYLYHLSVEKANSRTDLTSMALKLAKGVHGNETIKVVKYSNFTQVSSTTIDPKNIGKENDLKEKGSTPEVT